jgi:hypothetical protein
MKKIITGIMMMLALLFGGLATSVTAQAEPDSGDVTLMSGADVHFMYVEGDIPNSIDLHNTSMSGYQYLQSLGELRHFVYKTCPKSDDFRLRWSHDGGITWTLKPAGECLVPTVYSGTYRVSYVRA